LNISVGGKLSFEDAKLILMLEDNAHGDVNFLFYKMQLGSTDAGEVMI
jgi:hypothetical protein